MTKVLIADDHDLIRQGLKSILALDSQYELVAEAVDGEDAIAKAKEFGPDVILLDITMPKCSGLDAIKELQYVAPQAMIIIISVHKAEPYIAKALDLGVKGYLLKDNAAQELLPALVRILKGDLYLGESVSAIVANSLVKKNRGGEGELVLTPREKEILRLVVEGKTAKQIADILFISTRTVENNKNALLKKFNMHRTVDLVKYAVEHKLVD